MSTVSGNSETLQQRIIDSEIARKETSSSSYQAMIQQSTDGDASEVFVKADMGRTIGDGSDQGRDPVSQQEGRALQRRPVSSIMPTYNTAVEDEVVENLRKRKRTKKTVGKKLIQGQHQAPSGEASHDQFQLATSAMKTEEAATFACFEAFLNITKILMQDTWFRKVKASDELMRKQMSTTS